MKREDWLYRKALCFFTFCQVPSPKSPASSGTGVPKWQEENAAALITGAKKCPFLTNPYLVLQCIFTI